MFNEKKISACGMNRVCGYPEQSCDYFQKVIKLPFIKASLPYHSYSVCLFLDEGVFCTNKTAWYDRNEKDSN